MKRPARSPFVFVLAHAILTQTLTFAIRPALSYAVLEAGGSAAAVGVIAASFAIPALVLALPVGHAIDRLGERPALLLGSLAFVAAALIAALGRGSLWMLIVAAVVLGFAHLLSVVGDQAMLSNGQGTRSLDSMFGFYGFAAAFGQTLGPLLLALPGGARSIPPLTLVFAVCAALGTALLLISAFMVSSKRHHSIQVTSMRRKTGVLLRTSDMPKALLVGSLVISSVDLFFAYVPPLALERGYSVETVSVILMTRSLFAMASRALIAPLTARIGRRRFLVGSVLLSSLTIGAIALPLPELWMFGLAAVYGFAVGGCQPLTMSWTAELSPADSRALAVSLRIASNRVGQATLPLIFGGLAVATGTVGVFAATGAALAVAAWTSTAFGRHQHSADETNNR